MDKTQQLMVFAIDDKLRTITMPNNGSVFGVSGDIEVNQVEFQMPRYCAGFDMTDFTGRVNYVNPNGDSNYYEAEISGTDDAVSFIWLMKPDVTRYSGDVKFSVKLYKKQDGKLLKQFNTRSAVGRVLEGFDVVDSITPEEQETLLHKIEAEIKEDIKAYIDQYAEDKVSEMTQGLPEAVNSLKEDIGDLSSENGIDYKQINSALTQNKTHLKDTSSDGSCYVSNDVVKSNNVSGYKKMQIDVSELPDSGTLVIPFTESGGNDFAIIASEKSDWPNNPLVKQTYTYSTLVNNDHSAASYFHLKWNNNGDGTASLDCTTIKSHIDSRPMLCFFIKNDNNQWFIPYILSSGKKKKLSWLITDEDNLGEGIDWNIYNGFANIFNKVVCIGDSLTFGQLSGKNSSTQVHSPYPKVLSKLLNTTVDVVAVPGITSKGWYDNKYSSVDFDNYDCAIIWLGTNGGVNYPVGSSATDENTIAYQNIIDGIKSQNPQCKIVCIGNVMPFYTRVLRDIAKEKNCIFLDIYHGQLMFDIRRSTADADGITIYHPSESDWVHFSQIGYIAVANIIYRMLCKAIFENHDYFEFVN